MRTLFILLALSLVLAWVGYEVREKYRAVSNVLFGFAGLFVLILMGAFLDWH